MFQFQIGAIKRLLARQLALVAFRFNSKLVRLKVKTLAEAEKEVQFQFQIGAIKRKKRAKNLESGLRWFQFQIGAIKSLNNVHV